MKSNSMKKIVVLLVFLILTSACNTRGELPYGVWQSEEPNITLYFDPKIDEDVFSGTYMKDGENINIVVLVSSVNKGFRIYNESLYYSEHGLNYVDSYRDSYYSGDYRVRGNKLRYKLRPYWQEQTGIKTIVFEK